MGVKGISKYRPHPCPTCGVPFHIVDAPKQVYCSWKCRPKRSPEQLLWWGVVRGEGCWEKSSPYHAINVDGRQVGAHRLSYTLAYGLIPPGMYVCHRCDNKRCVRPDHLFLGTNRDNQLDARDKGLLPIGERNARAKLTAAQVAEIRRRLAAGEGPTRLASDYGVSRPTIQAIKQGRNWRSTR